MLIIWYGRRQTSIITAITDGDGMDSAATTDDDSIDSAAAMDGNSDRAAITDGVYSTESHQEGYGVQAGATRQRGATRSFAVYHRERIGCCVETTTTTIWY